MRLSQNQIDYIAFKIYKTLAAHPQVDVKNPDAIISAVRREIKHNLKLEQEIEKEAEAMLAPHKEKILREGADYADMLRSGIRTIAKKRGVVL